MSNENLTEIICVFDRSGSMGSIRDDAAGAFNAFIEEQQKVSGEANVTLVQFNTEYDTVWENKPINECPKYTLMPRGATALLDAMGKTINRVGERFDKLPEKKHPGKVIFVIVTDGQENSSCEFKRAQIMEMVKHQTDKYNWQFLFLAANQDAIGEAASIGIRATNAMNYASTNRGIRSAVRGMSASMARYRMTGKASDLDLPDFANDEDSQKLKKQ